MAMIHPEDEGFALSEPVSITAVSSLFEGHTGLVPTKVTSPTSSQGLFHKVYFISLPEGEGRWAGKDLVLRVAR